jgi:hypothetical protein
MPRYRVTLSRTSVETVTADNPYQAAIVASNGHGDVEVADVRPAVGRAPASTGIRATVKSTPVKKAAKKRRPMSAEARAKLAQNLIKARAARARNIKAAKKATKKSPAKKKATKKVAVKKSVKKTVAKKTAKKS